MDILFLIKKAAIAILSPLSIALLIGLASWWLFSHNHRTSGLTLLTISLLFTWAVSFGPISNSLIKHHESQLKAFTFQEDLDVDVIHVLGGGHTESPRFANGAQLSSSSLARVVEGIRVAQLYPEAKLVFSGYSGYEKNNQLSNAEVAGKLAISLGVNEERMRLLTESKDTREEAIDVADFIDEGRLILVTSASHMPRAIKIFKQEGIAPIPAPTYFLGTDKSQQYYPSFQALQQSERYIYEKVGEAWITLRGWITS